MILAHYYQEGAIQDIADFIGDSLELSRQAAGTDAEVIVFCGVHFMAETAKILSPAKTVLIPDLDAGCSLADACPADAFAAFRAEHPDHITVSYINCSAAVKAQSDLICTSSNAVALVKQLPADRPILFGPDQNLGRWVQSQSGRELTLWPGSCIVHETFSEQALLQLKLEHPQAEVLAHPECPPEVIAASDFAGSTAAMSNYVRDRQPGRVVLITECSMSDNIAVHHPEIEYIRPCRLCPHMKQITLPKIREALELMQFEVKVDPAIAGRARLAVERMLAVR